MEHIIQFAIGIDDDAIRKRVEENSEKVIIDSLLSEIRKTIFDKDYYGRPTKTLSTWAGSYLEAFLDANKGEIIKCAGEILAERLARTKAVREMVDDLKRVKESEEQ